MHIQLKKSRIKTRQYYFGKVIIGDKKQLRQNARRIIIDLNSIYFHLTLIKYPNVGTF